MSQDSLDWWEIKSERPFEWREKLAEETLNLFSDSRQVELSQYNEKGYYHKVSSEEIFEKMRQEWKDNDQVPEEWISRGKFPGIWTAMFNPINTFSRKTGALYALRFYFKDGYHIYDSKSPEKKEKWEEWDKQDLNPWAHLENGDGETLKERLESGLYRPFPSHKKFYEENDYGAAIGYSDYISPVILLEESISDVKFQRFEDLEEL